MVDFQNIVNELGVLQCVGDTKRSLSKLIIDSRQAEKGDLFVAVNGLSVDGHDYIAQAVEHGACAVICERLPDVLCPDVTYVIISHTGSALGQIAKLFYADPSSSIRLVGVTGTNGKTSVASWLFQLFSRAGYKVGLISTVENFIHDKRLEATHTTPDVVSLNRLLAEMVRVGCEFCFMEVSSHAIHQNRLSDIQFQGAVFTNISHDHLDYHGSFQAYIRVKKMFFDQLPQHAFALTNVDDKQGDVMLQNTRAKKMRYASLRMAEYTGRILEQDLNGMLVQINHRELWVQCIGLFNLYNLLAVYGVAVQLGMDEEEVLLHMSKIIPVEGRFEHVRSESGVTAVMDYAHTPDALKNVLQTLRQLLQRNAKIITVVGAGGNRDQDKRPLMAREAALLSDLVVLTSDNPRYENPADIIRQMEGGVPEDRIMQVLSITDRKQAIKTAIRMAEAGDVILVAGKGHEHYQEIEGVRYPFYDKKVVLDLFRQANNK